MTKISIKIKDIFKDHWDAFLLKGHPTRSSVFKNIDKFIKCGGLLHLLFEVSANTILTWFYKLNKSENFKPGFIPTMHTFGRDLKWNLHIHILLTKGVLETKTTWKRISHSPFNMLSN